MTNLPYPPAPSSWRREAAPIVIAFAALLSAIGGVWAGAHKLDGLATGQQEIHVLVNARLTEALEKITRLEARIEALTGEKPPIKDK